MTRSGFEPGPPRLTLTYFFRRAKVAQQFSCLVSFSTSFDLVSKEFNVYVYANGSPLFLCCSRCGSAYFSADSPTSDIHNVNDYRRDWEMGHRREFNSWADDRKIICLHSFPYPTSVVGFCKHSNGHSGFIKGRKLRNHLNFSRITSFLGVSL
jgi:hypothetical protein